MNLEAMLKQIDDSDVKESITTGTTRTILKVLLVYTDTLGQIADGASDPRDLAICAIQHARTIRTGLV